MAATQPPTSRPITEAARRRPAAVAVEGGGIDGNRRGAAPGCPERERAL